MAGAEAVSVIPTDIFSLGLAAGFSRSRRGLPSDRATYAPPCVWGTYANIRGSKNKKFKNQEL